MTRGIRSDQIVEQVYGVPWRFGPFATCTFLCIQCVDQIFASTKLRGPVYKKKNLTKKINIDVHALSCKSNGKKKKIVHDPGKIYLVVFTSACDV